MPLPRLPAPAAPPVASPAAAALAALPAAELVAMVAALMALNALAIDVMLPALDLIAADLGVARGNDQQLVVLVYVIGFGTPQLAFGPLTDRFGRRPVLFTSLVGYTVGGLACMVAGSFPLLLAARFVQGVFASGCRVVAVAVVRDAYGGPRMARTMSLVMTVFMVVPILAPAIGQAVLAFAPWQGCFAVLAAAGLGMLGWAFARLPETLAAGARRPLDLASTLGAYREVLSHRATRGYTIASGITFGALFAYISSSEQIFREVFDEGARFPLWFALIATAMSATNFVNARLVERVGMRRLSHLALVAFVALALVLYGLMATTGERLVVFLPLFAMLFALFGLIGANFNAMALDPLGRLAGTGSAAYGFSTSTVAGLVGGGIGRLYDGTTLPVLAGFVGLGAAALAVVVLTEGRAFASR